MSDVKFIEKYLDQYQQLRKEIAKVIVGQEADIEQNIISIFTGGHL